MWLASSALVIFVLGLGYKVGLDWVSYQDNYYYNNDSEGFEPLYNLLSRLFASLNINFWFFAIFIKSVNVILLLSIFKRYTKLPILTVTIFLALTYPYINDVLRQIVASIILLSSFLLFKKMPSILSIILSTGFHTSSLMLLLGKFNVFKLSSKKFTILIILSSIGFGSLLMGLLSSGLFTTLNIMAISKLQMYSEDSNIANIYSSIVRLSIYALALYFQTRVSNVKSGINDWIYRATLLMLIIELLTMSIPIISQRVRLYLLPFVCIALTNGIATLPKGTKLILIGYVLSYCILFLYLFTHGVFGAFYQIDMNILIQLLRGFPPNNWESAAYSFWKYR
ncbi:EpsG family protein [Psychrobacter sp.]|uniref:EpsG family protein n=1 Tax=Psychrobacter sp. TaxID=56811 RepID=UPI0025FE7752|nr:EpsG family protein [Psychrobacter sp.]